MTNKQMEWFAFTNELDIDEIRSFFRGGLDTGTGFDLD